MFPGLPTPVIFIAAGLACSCATTSPDDAARQAPGAGRPLAQNSASADSFDAGVKAGKPRDEELPEGVRMLGDHEDPTRIGASADEEKVLCKRMGVTGSRVASQRVCKTRREWREERLAAQRGMRQRQDRNSGAESQAAGSSNPSTRF